MFIIFVYVVYILLSLACILYDHISSFIFKIFFNADISVFVFIFKVSLFFSFSPFFFFFFRAAALSRVLKLSEVPVSPDDDHHTEAALIITPDGLFPVRDVVLLQPDAMSASVFPVFSGSGESSCFLFPELLSQLFVTGLIILHVS